MPKLATEIWAPVTNGIQYGSPHIDILLFESVLDVDSHFSVQNQS